MKYLLPVVALSILFNIPKFFEAEFKLDNEAEDTDGNSTDLGPILQNYISVKKILETFSSSSFGQISTQKHQRFVDINLRF
jgi:hypothetical protein